MESCIKQHAGGRTFSCLSLATDILGLPFRKVKSSKGRGERSTPAENSVVIMITGDNLNERDRCRLFQMSEEKHISREWFSEDKR
jgi:hypothetical protein